jgi:hypothetical protein
MMKKYHLLLCLTLSLLVFGQKEYYELRTYSIPFNGSEKALHNYLQNILLPALNRYGVEDIGVFEAIGEPTPKQLVLLIPYKNIKSYGEVITELQSDSKYLDKRKTYDSVPHDNRAYTRFSSSFYIAFDGLPKIIKPKKESLLFELRTYEGYSEDAVRRKVKMFNEEEFAIFDETGLHSVFFGEQVSGPLMPALTYMLSFNSMEERNANWKKFLVHPEWKRISGLKEYAHSVSEIKRTFLKPLSYSQL